MNAGLSNLAALKAQVLGPSLLTRTDWDAQIQAIGLGAAAAFENFCNRKFLRAVADTEVFDADRTQFLLARFPLESVTKAEFKQDEATGWVDQGAVSDFVRAIDLKSGMITLPDKSDPGQYWSQLRFTFTGGYFWETLEPADQGYPTAAPTGAATLPPDLLLAWFLQCRAVWAALDKQGLGILTEGESKGSGTQSSLQLTPMVKQLLTQFVRYQLT